MKILQSTNKNSLRWFNERYADLTAEELIERYNRLFGANSKQPTVKNKHKKKFVKQFKYSFYTNKVRHI